MSPVNNGSSSDKLLQIVIIANSIGLFGLIGWIITMSFTMGGYVNQITTSRERIQQIEDKGTSGTTERLDAIRERLDAQDKRLARIETILDSKR